MYYNNYTLPLVKEINPFSPIILKASYKDFNTPSIKSFLEDIKKLKPKTDTNWSTGDSFDENKIPHLNTAFKKFYDWLNPIIMDTIINKFGYDSKMEYALYNSWINLHQPGGETATHHHGPSIISVAAYLYMPTNGGYIEFKDPLEYQRGFYPTEIDDEFINWKELPTITGDVVMFPGWLRHRTQKNKSAENRWVLTTNYICTNILKK